MNRTIQKKVDRNISCLSAGEMVGIKIVDFHSKSLKISDFHGNKDRFGTDLGSKTSRIPEHMFRGVIRPWGC